MEVIALWTDSNQTGEPVETLYGSMIAYPLEPGQAVTADASTPATPILIFQGLEGLYDHAAGSRTNLNCARSRGEPYES